jgi:hypothetical protein
VVRLAGLGRSLGGKPQHDGDRLLVLSDGLGAALGAMGILGADGTTGIKPFG